MPIANMALSLGQSNARAAGVDGVGLGGPFGFPGGWSANGWADLVFP